MKAKAKCPGCKSEIGVTSDGALFLHHYTQGPGIGLVCEQSGKSTEPPEEEES